MGDQPQLSDAQLVAVLSQKLAIVSAAARSFVERYYGLRLAAGEISADAVMPLCMRDLGQLQQQMDAVKPPAPENGSSTAG